MDFKSIDEKFLLRFPEKFKDPSWKQVIKIFNTPKKITDLYNTDLSASTLETLIEYGEYRTITDSVLRLINSSNVISRFEKIAFTNYVSEKDTHEPLSLALYDLLYHFDENSFNRMVSVLGMYRHDKNMNVLKWPILTLFNFYRDPDNYILMKPNTVKSISKAFDVDLSYIATPNYNTYLNVLNFVKKYRDSSSVCSEENLKIAQTILFAVTSSS